MIVLFWISAAIAVYVYAGYPCLLALRARFADRRPRRARFSEGRWPSISIILAARNEAARLPARVRNLLDQAYPGRCEIVVVSDGSTDDPAAALADFGGAVRILEGPTAGKPAALNAGVAATTGEILVFADARQRFAPDALVEMIADFADPAVGDGIGLYWLYEKWLRRNESRVWSTLGATGAIYALRRSCWTPLPATTLIDDVLAPMRAVLAGWRVVYEERAVAYDRASMDAAAEAHRKTRTLAGNYQILFQEPRLLVPFLNPVWLQYVSHKVGRLLAPWALISLFIATLAIAPAHPLGAVLLAAQGVFYGLAIGCALFHARERVARLAFTFVLMNISAIAALAALRRGREVWR